MADLSKGKKVLSTSGKDLKGKPLEEVAHELFGVSEASMSAARAEAKEKQVPLGGDVVKKKILCSTQVAELWSAHWGIAFIDVIDVEAIPDELLNALPISFAKQNRLMPIALLPDERV